MPEELWMEVHDILEETVIKTIPKKRIGKNGKCLSKEALQVAEKEEKLKENGKDIPM